MWDKLRVLPWPTLRRGLAGVCVAAMLAAALAGAPVGYDEVSGGGLQRARSGSSSGGDGEPGRDPRSEPLPPGNELPFGGDSPAGGPGDGPGDDSTDGDTVPVAYTRSGIPKVAMRAYRHAAELIERTDPGCNLEWSLLAAIGRVESNHGRYGESSLQPSGLTTPPILGLVLDGSQGTARIPDTDGGRLDGHERFDRAVGPMQFLPSTWAEVGVDGNGDGRANPNNIFDAALSAGRYLCAGDVDLSRPGDLHDAVYSYNHSSSYVRLVLELAASYAAARQPTSDVSIPEPVNPPEPYEPPQGEDLPPATSDDTVGGIDLSPDTEKPGESGNDFLSGDSGNADGDVLAGSLRNGESGNGLGDGGGASGTGGGALRNEKGREPGVDRNGIGGENKPSRPGGRISDPSGNSHGTQDEPNEREEPKKKVPPQPPTGEKPTPPTGEQSKPPTVRAITNGGSAGDTVRITGGRLKHVTVTLGGVAVDPTRVRRHLIVATVPPLPEAGFVPVVVRGPDGVRVARQPFAYLPEIDAVQPAKGPTEGGGVVAVRGTGLRGATVYFGEAVVSVVAPEELDDPQMDGQPVSCSPADADAGLCLLVRVPSATAAGIEVPEGETIDVDVVARHGGMHSVSPAPSYTYHNPLPPLVLDPAAGAAGTSHRVTVILNRTRLVEEPTVTVDEEQLDPQAVDEPGDSGTRLTVVLPPHEPGRVTVTVDPADGDEEDTELSTVFVYRPVVDKESVPANVSPGQRVTLTGTGFDPDSTVVLLAREEETRKLVQDIDYDPSNGSLSFRVPPETEPGTYDLVVHVGKVTSLPIPITVVPEGS